MANAYGLYKEVRDATWQVLLDNRIDTLPVSVVKIPRNNDIMIIKNSEVENLRENESGASIYDGDKWYIIYDDTIASAGRKRFTIAHELGHIFLGHPLLVRDRLRSVDISGASVESSADIFASRLLSPACVLWGLNLRSASEIATACNISFQSAQIRAKRMELLYKRNKFLTSPLERKLYSQFEDFITNNER